jgi:hypothetical protein
MDLIVLCAEKQTCFDKICNFLVTGLVCFRFSPLKDEAGYMLELE